MGDYSTKQVLAKFRELHRRLHGADRDVSIAKMMRYPAEDPFTKGQKLYAEYTLVTPPPIVTDTPDLQLSQRIGRAIGRDEKVFVFLSESLVERDPVSTLGARCEDLLATLAGQGRGAVKYGETLYAISAFYWAADPIRGVVPQWAVVAKVVK